ncbi:hypothetical protein AUH73_07770 [archaeon 13_1_40CM_4_53_4]|nr:MAG: hypothetical protein AUI07_06820 [archaeon 13_2_20CM_2_53_6]OLC61217.1 MAG: hypothetical protein AUH73_07770 [archaeon 13_1_40CM_4_53_4]OLE58772.1 MAG: hypothetical protein AUG17_05815 [Crenarchaeota archaeon 13_1_20CM_2_53_14]TMI23428.1 MAG: DUF371 domain-containing protein [Candidatus Bathyarchaeota archaeon]
MSFTFHAYGHPSVLSTHPSTIEITKAARLSSRGDCIVAVNSSVGPTDLPDALRTILSTPGARARLVLGLGRFQFIVEGEGDPRLTLNHPTDLVVRRSGFISDRTLMIHADKAASDLPREMVRLLRDPRNRVSIEISTKAPG